MINQSFRNNANGLGQLPYLTPLAPNSELVVSRPLELLGELQKLWAPPMNIGDYNPSLAAAMMSMNTGGIDNLGLHYLANTSLCNAISPFNPMLPISPLGGLLNLAPAAIQTQQLAQPTVSLPQDTTSSTSNTVESNPPMSPTGGESPTKKSKDKRLRFIEERPQEQKKKTAESPKLLPPLKRPNVLQKRRRSKTKMNFVAPVAVTVKSETSTEQKTETTTTVAANTQQTKPVPTTNASSQKPKVEGSLPHPPQKKSKSSRNCIYCGTTNTPEWRRGPDGNKSLCNACGLHFAKIIKKERESQPFSATSASARDKCSLAQLMND